MSILSVIVVLALAVAEDTDEEDIASPLPGLVATWSDGQEDVTQLEGRLAFRFAPGESPHPLLDSRQLNGRWQGRLFVQRPGMYRFQVETTGSFKLQIAGRQVLDLTVTKSGAPASKTSQPIELAYGEIPLEATFAKVDEKDARLRVLWQLGDTPAEPIPAAVLRHTADQETKSLANWQQVEQGRRLVLEHRCVKCHTADEGTAALAAQTRSAAQLDAVGSRVYADWIYHWLLFPHEVRPGTLMPRLFGQSLSDQIDVYGVTQLLMREGQPLMRPSDQIDAASVERGRHAFAVTGCIACHRFPGEKTQGPGDLRSLNSLGSKMTAAGIAAHIADPGAHHPETLMPDFEMEKTDPDRVKDMAAFLASHRNNLLETSPAPPTVDQLARRYDALVANEAERKRFARLDEIDRWKTLGQHVVQARGCLNCHQLGELKSSAPPAPGFARLIAAAQSGRAAGCLAEEPSGRAPRLALDRGQRHSVRKFLAHGAGDVQSTSPTHEARFTLDRHGCTACHRRHGAGGTLTERIKPYLPQDPNQIGPDVFPPDLSGVGEKLRPDWLHQVIVKNGRARPWLDVIMPRYRERDVAALPRQLIVADGEDPDDRQEPPEPTTPEHLEAARLLVGRTGMNCVSCHDVLGHKSTGVRGPDLAGIFTRVRGSWFRRWLTDPQRITPGTRMPTVFYGGKSAAPQFLGGDPEAQLGALWAYLAQGERLEMPLLEPVAAAIAADGEALRPVPTDRPLLRRSFMVGQAGLRAIALGFPEETHFAFDSDQCRLALAWKGDFVEIGGWTDNGRGSTEDNSLKILGNVCWHAPDRFPFAWTNSDGQSLPMRPARPYPVRYDACWAAKGDAGFAYRAQTGGRWIDIEERPAPAAGVGQVAFRRSISLEGEPPGYSTSFCFHDRLPERDGITLLDRAGRAVDVPRTASTLAAETQAAPWLRYRTPDGLWFISTRTAPPGTRWLLGDNEGWLELPSAKAGELRTISLIYVLSKDNDPSAIATWETRLATVEGK